MKKIIISILLVFLLVFSAKPTKAQDYIWMIGPMLHTNFGIDGIHFSLALEASYWDITHFPYGYDAGIEFEKNKVRIYTELQSGIGLAGISGGPVLQLPTIENKAKLGFQGSVWANYFVGIDLRLRVIDDTKYFCPGVYGKLPVKFYSADTDTTNSSSHSDWGDMFDK